MHVTVLMPVYDRESFVADSVITQDYGDWDVLVVENGSTDRTVELVKSRMSDDRITLIQMKHGGCAAATAMGIGHSHVTYWRRIHPHRIGSEHFDGQMDLAPFETKVSHRKRGACRVLHCQIGERAR